MVGTPRNTVTRSSAMIDSACSPSNFGSSVKHGAAGHRSVQADRSGRRSGKAAARRRSRRRVPSAAKSRSWCDVAAQVGVGELGALRAGPVVPEV